MDVQQKPHALKPIKPLHEEGAPSLSAEPVLQDRK